MDSLGNTEYEGGTSELITEPTNNSKNGGIEGGEMEHFGTKSVPNTVLESKALTSPDLTNQKTINNSLTILKVTLAQNSKFMEQK